MLIKYRPEIDGLRAVAVIPVILFHSGVNGFGGGYVGVDVFFVLSGYLITSILAAEQVVGTYSILNFYERRARRILPALFFVIACSLVPAWLLMAPHQLKDFSQSLVAVSVFSSNILFWQESGYFEASTELKPLLHTWSLGVEEQFYLLFPFFLLFVLRLRQNVQVAIISISVLCSLCLAQWGSVHQPSANFFLLPSRAWELLIGAAIALKLLGNDHSAKSNTWAWIGFALITFSVLVFDEDTPFPSVWTLIPVLGTSLLIYCSSPSTALGRVLSSWYLVRIGLISFSLYLWHQPILAFTRIWRPEVLQSAWGAPVLLLAIFLMASLTYKLIEQPFRSQSKTSRKAILTLTLTGTLAFSTIGYIGHHTDGFLAYKLANIPMSKRGLLIDVGAALSARTDLVEHHSRMLRTSNFSAQSEKRRILIIGDSIGEDLATAFANKSALFSHHEFRFIKVAKECVNDFVYERDRQLADARICDGNSFAVSSLVKDADQVVVTFLWKSDFDFIRTRAFLENLKSINANVLVLGGGGYLDMSSIAYQVATDKSEFSQSRIDELVAKSRRSEFDIGNDRVSRISKELNLRYEDRHDLYCTSKNSCRILYGNGRSIIFDGAHLTVFGMDVTAERIYVENWIQ